MTTNLNLDHAVVNSACISKLFDITIVYWLTYLNKRKNKIYIVCKNSHLDNVCRNDLWVKIVSKT